MTTKTDVGSILVDAPYDGRAGRTRTESVHVQLGGVGVGASTSVQVVRGVNAETDPTLAAQALDGTLHRLDNGQELAMSFVYHDPAKRKLAVVVPELLRHTVLAERAKLLALVAEDVDARVPSYVAQATVVVGREELRQFLEAQHPRSLRPGEKATVPPEAVAAELELAHRMEQADRELEARANELRAAQTLLEKRGLELDHRLLELEQRGGELESRSTELARRERDLDAKVADVMQRRGELEAAKVDFDARAAELDAKVSDLDARNAALEERVVEIEQRAVELDERDAAFDHRLRELQAAERDLATREQQLRDQEQVMLVREESMRQREQRILARAEDVTLREDELRHLADALEASDRALRAREEALELRGNAPVMASRAESDAPELDVAPVADEELEEIEGYLQGDDGVSVGLRGAEVTEAADEGDADGVGRASRPDSIATLDAEPRAADESLAGADSDGAPAAHEADEAEAAAADEAHEADDEDEAHEADDEDEAALDAARTGPGLPTIPPELEEPLPPLLDAAAGLGPAPLVLDDVEEIVEEEDVDEDVDDDVDEDIDEDIDEDSSIQLSALDEVPLPLSTPTKTARPPARSEPVRFSDVTALKTPAAPEVAPPASFFADRALEACVSTAADVVWMYVRVESARIDSFCAGELDVLTQLVMVQGVPVALLTAVATQDERSTLRRVALDPRRGEGREILESLRRVYQVNVALYDEQDLFVGMRVVSAAREVNVAVLLERATRIPQGDEDMEAALERAVSAPPPVREQGHPFQPLVPEPKTAKEALTLVTKLATWTTSERLDHVALVLSVPRDHVDYVTRLILASAVRFGLALPATLRERALAHGVASDAAALATHSVDAFQKIVALEDQGGLTQDEVAQNWEKLLAEASEFDIFLEPAVHEQARALVRAVRGDTSDVARKSIAPEQMKETPVADLIPQLEHPKHRLAAALELCARMQPELVDPVYKAVRKMARTEVVRVVPALVSFREAAGDALIDGLGARKTFVRQACALALGHLKLRRALVPLIHALQAEETDIWKEIARAIGDFGPSGFRQLSRSLKDPKAHRERFSVTLAHLANHGCGVSVDTLGEDRDPQIGELARDAMAMRLAIEAEDKAVRHGVDGYALDPVRQFSRRFFQEIAGTPPEAGLLELSDQDDATATGG